MKTNLYKVAITTVFATFFMVAGIKADGLTVSQQSPYESGYQEADVAEYFLTDVVAGVEQPFETIELRETAAVEQPLTHAVAGEAALDKPLEAVDLRETAAVEQPQRGSVTGTATDAETGAPVAYVTVVILELNRAGTGHEDGSFIVPNLAPGVYTLRVHRVGYAVQTRNVRVEAGQATRIDFKLRPSAFQSRAIEVTGRRINNGEVYTPEIRISGRELRQHLGRTLAETLQNEPGMAQSTMGPAPARPVLRGLSGDRLVLLEDGRTTGDVSTSAPDHAVTIDPINSQYIEILRGPSALIYTSNAMAGVVNVVRGQIPTELPEHFHGAASVQGETVNQGLSAGLATYTSRGNLGIRGDLGLRLASDIQTPEGSLDNTAIQSLHGGLGLSRIDHRGLLGFSANAFLSSYGIPGDFIGSHPNGVKINLQRYQADVRRDIDARAPWLRNIRLNYTFSYYFHEELEFSPQRQAFDIVGYQAELLTNTFTARFTHDELGLATRGTFGVYAQHQYNRPGGFTFTPLTNDLSLALFGYQDIRLGDWNLHAGLRADVMTIIPIEEVETAIGLRRQRTLANVSGGLQAMYPLSSRLSTSISLMRTVRMPGVEELFSEGPHLPAYSYETGNPDLNEEIGHGADWMLRFAAEHFGLQASVFYYTYSNYLYPRATGEESVRRPLPIYQFTGEPARLMGAEVLAEVDIFNGLRLTGTLSYVEGDLTRRNEPIPFIPPLTGKVDLKYTRGVYTIGSSARFASAQNRLGEFEEPTDGYRVFDAFAQAHFTHGTHMHTFSLTLENIADTTYRMHLSRVKAIMPEPGRNIKLLYRMYF
ncbi:MAG: TonB-dependent receptor [Balneolales bacterium]|nr:TonB-dependent receptor [Balneolales bacterium]